MVLHHRGCPIRKSAGQRLLPPNRSLSQVITSFFGSQCQGIHLMLFFAWTALLHSPFFLWEFFSFFAWASQIIVFWVVNKKTFLVFNLLICPPRIISIRCWRNCFFPLLLLRKNLYFNNNISITSFSRSQLYFHKLTLTTICFVSFLFGFQWTFEWKKT